LATNFPTIKLGSPGEEISIRDLHEVQLRFKKLHQQKAQQVYNFLEPKQRVVLESLPLLFHCNVPLLPGFISTLTPSGILGYTPSTAALKAVKKFSKNFQLPQKNNQEFPITGLFLMGSVGSIAFSKSSDIDIWLCHDSTLGMEELAELQKKATAIEIWADSLDLEVHFFLMDSDKFLRGEDSPLSTESSGKTQHYLLLEEFYRTAIYVAGQSPAWWLVPPHQEKNYPAYINHLQHNRFVLERELIDFGGFNNVPAEEFISATLWHLYKSLHSPHKSFLKLLLMECYASEYPDTQWLCQDIKRAIYDGDFANTDLDPYLLIYKKVEAYLLKNQSSHRLELVRECFYLKVMGTTSGAIDKQIKLAREQAMANLARIWRWPPSTLQNLKKNQFWDIKKATQEHAVILKQLTHCYQMIMRFANEHVQQNRPNNDDLKLIGRKLHAFLEKKPGKIEIITTRSTIQAREAELSIVEVNASWGLYLKNVQIHNADQHEPIHQCRTLIEILGWLVINGLFHKQLQVHFSADSCLLDKFELQTIISGLHHFFEKNLLQEDALSTFQTPRALLQSLLIVNMGNTPNSRDDGTLILSERSDVLSYGMDRLCLIESIDCVSLSSWSEITTTQYQGIEGFLTCLTYLINNTQKPLSPDNWSIFCQTPVRAKSINLRMQSVLKSLIKLFSTEQVNQEPRYYLAGGKEFFVFQKVNQVLGYRSLFSENQILADLGSPQRQFGRVNFDVGVLENTPIPLIYSFNKAQIIQLFYAENKGDVTIYIIDERGALYVQCHHQANTMQLLNHYTDFLEAILIRNLYETLLTLEYYEIQKSRTGVLSCNSLHLKIFPIIPKLTLRITGETQQGVTSYTAFCNEQEFSSLYYGNHVFNAVYQYILQFRQSKQDYPIYISDIDLPMEAFHLVHREQLQTIHYLNYKQKIEAKLNS
jgi:adenylate cyclase class 1